MEDKDLIIETTLLAGKIMIENGADMARIDDTLKRIAKNSGVTEPVIRYKCLKILTFNYTKHNFILKTYIFN